MRGGAIVLVVAAVVTLSLTDKLEPSILVLFGTLAGYVFGRGVKES